jgi:type IV pilus assembly protein PilM
MFTRTFFKLFPPPHYLNIPYSGLDISEDAIRAVDLGQNSKGFFVRSFGVEPLAKGVIESGQIKDEKALIQGIKNLKDRLKLSVVRASLPEERMYLFKLEVPTTDENEIRQLIEFKLEENVPLSPSEALFFFDLIPNITKVKQRFVSVSVAPQELVNGYLNAIKSAGLSVISFDIQPKAIARSIVQIGSLDTEMIVHIMNRKTGVYIVTGGVLCFTSTISWGSENIDNTADIKKELGRVYEYWKDRGQSTIGRIVVSGKTAVKDGLLSSITPNPSTPIEVAKVWRNAFSVDNYIPPISYEDSLDYAVAIGLSLPIQ